MRAPGWIYPTLRVHTWGGFGSQLFAAQLILKIKKDFPLRKIKVFVHTSGVTRRYLEFDFQKLGVNSKVVDDFKSSETTGVEKLTSLALRLKVKYLLSLLFSQILKNSAIVLNADDNCSYSKIKPWTLEIRGHYTRLTLETSILYDLFQVLYSSSTKDLDPEKKAVIHYRLGDLLHLQNKQPIHPTRIEGLLDSLDLANRTLILLSDSSMSEFDLLLKPASVLRRCNISNLDALQTIQSCVDADIFIGSTAKLSLWSAIFRSFIFQRESFLPNELSWSAAIGLKAHWY